MATTTRQRDVEAWLDQYVAAVTAADFGASAATWAAYDDIDDWTDPAQTLRAAAGAVAAAEAARRTHAGLIGEFTAQITHMLAGRRTAISRGLPDYPRNADPFKVYSRPVHDYRRALVDGLDEDVAREAARDRVEVLALTDALLTRRDEALRALVDAEVTHYRRVIRPELSKTGTCGLCIAAATRKYSTEDLMPIHSLCKCVVMPIIGDTDPGDINQADLEQLYSEIPATRREELVRFRFKVEQNGELGPVLVPDASSRSIPRAQPARDVDSERTVEQLGETLAQLEASGQRFSTAGTRARLEELRGKIRDREQASGGSNDAGAGGAGTGGGARRTVGDFIPTADPTSQQQAEIADGLTQLYAGQYGPLQAGQATVFTAEKDFLYFELEFLDDQGSHAGFANRVFNRDPDGTVWVHHENIGITKEHRGKGFGHAFTAFSEAWYRESGVDRIEVTAALETGGYAWAMAEYYWAHDTAASYDVIPRLERALDDGKGTPAERSAAQQILERFRRAPFHTPAYPAPLDVARLGRLGYEVMHGATWEGVKRL